MCLKTIIQSEMKQVTVFFGWVIKSLTQMISLKTLIQSGMKTSDCLYEQITESVTQTVCSITLIHSGTTKHHYCVLFSLCLWWKIGKVTGNIVSKM